jgi:monolysocardiolipin acyltransferase
MAEIGTGQNFPPEQPTLLQKGLSCFLAIGLVTPALGLFMNLLNKTRIIGRENLARLRPPYIVTLNHLSLLDDLFLGPVIFFPNMLKGYRYLPYHAPEERNFYKKPIIAQFMRYAKAIPLLRGRGIYQEGVNRLINAVSEGGILQIYPEGTRTRTGEIGDGKEGVGRIVYESGAPVVPVYHQGMEKVLPIGRGIPRIGNEIRIVIGKPIMFHDELKQDNTPATWRLITTKIMDAIREQKTISEQKWGHKPMRVKVAAEPDGVI